jgi:hypothetical protein
VHCRPGWSENASTRNWFPHDAVKATAAQQPARRRQFEAADAQHAVSSDRSHELPGNTAFIWRSSSGPQPGATVGPAGALSCKAAEADMALARYFVLRHGQHWLVTLDGAPLARHETRAEATEEAIAMADHMGRMHHDADVMVVSDGQPPELVWTYGEDPLPGPGHLGDARSGHVRRVQRASEP